jgi:cytochrome c biogenesis protein CcmG, thiol:disulfide interchange protein DsbE
MFRDNKTLGMLFAVLFCGFLYAIHDQFEQRVIDVGDKAPFFSVRTESGSKITPTEFGGRLLVLNFWATWCPPCVEEMPSLNDFAQKMAAQNVVVVGVSIDKNEAAYKRFLQRNRLAFQTARDPDENISSTYGTFKWPETYVINREGKVVQKYVGPRDWNDPEIANSLRSLL